MIFLERNLSRIDWSNHSIQTRINNKENSIFSDFNLFDLVCRLYLITADKYIYNNQAQALKILSKYENLKIDSNFSADFYTRMARMHYECGSLEKAIYYTDKIMQISPKSDAIYFNRVFFGILLDDMPSLTSNLKIIFHKRNSIHFEVGIIDFLQKEIKKHPEKELMINIVLNFYQALFTDKSVGQNTLRDLIGKLENTNDTNDLRYLINRVI